MDCRILSLFMAATAVVEGRLSLLRVGSTSVVVIKKPTYRAGGWFDHVALAQDERASMRELFDHLDLSLSLENLSLSVPMLSLSMPTSSGNVDPIPTSPAIPDTMPPISGPITNAPAVAPVTSDGGSSQGTQSPVNEQDGQFVASPNEIPSSPASGTAGPTMGQVAMIVVLAVAAATVIGAFTARKYFATSRAAPSDASISLASSYQPSAVLEGEGLVNVPL